MKYSTTELSYLKDSLVSQPPIRPDARSASQFRPLEASTGFLPTANGSARVRTADGAECIVGVKAKVTREAKESELINVEVEVAGLRDDHSLPNTLGRIFQSTLSASPTLKNSLKISSKYSYKLFIDGMVISHTSHPLGLVSFTIYLALMTTLLPLLLSSTNDEDAEEIPMFNDDWDKATYLCPLDGWRPPLLFLGAIVGNNILVDPVQTEEMVSESGIVMGWANGKIIAPIQSLSLSTSSTHTQGLNKDILQSMYKLVNECGPDVAEALDHLISTSSSADTSVFL